MKPAIYYRVSTDKQDIESQKSTVEQFVKELAKKHGFNPEVPVYLDEGISGKTLNRPGFVKMLADASNGKIDNIIVFKLDRFSRNANDAIRLLIELDSNGVGFMSATQPALNLGTENPFRRTMLSAFAEIAEIERETLVERTKAGLEAARKRGVKLGQPIKTTYKVQKQILELRAQEISIRNIAKQLKLSVGSVHKVIKANVA